MKNNLHHFRMDESEYNILRVYSKITGKSISDLIRQGALEYGKRIVSRGTIEQEKE